MRQDDAENKRCPFGMGAGEKYCITTWCMAWQTTSHNPDKTVAFGRCKLIPKDTTETRGMKR